MEIENDNILRTNIRYETREQLPEVLELRATKIHPVKGETTTAYWVGNTTQDFKIKGKPFIPPVMPGSWMSLKPRSIMIPNGEKYRQHKGTGNPDRPNFPPTISPKNRDMGHETVWSVGKDEATAVAYKAHILEECGIKYSPIIGIVKLDEVPVPINENGGLEIRTIEDAYTKPWEHADHVRRRQIDQMRQVLKRKYLTDAKTDKEVVRFYNKHEGFYQIEVEKSIPFKNEIANLVSTPLVLDYLSGNKNMSLESQAENITWAMREIGKALNIQALESVEMPEFEDLETEMVIESADKFSQEAAILDFRPFAVTYKNITTERTAKILRKHYGLNKDDPLTQLDGITFVKRIVALLDDESKSAYLLGITNEQRQLVRNHINAVTNGVGLSQSISTKDSVLGEVSDIGVVGKVSERKGVSLGEAAISSAKQTEDGCLKSCIALSALTGTDTSDIMNYTLLKVTYGAMISSLAKKESIHVPDLFSDKDYPGRYEKAIYEMGLVFKEQRAKIEAEEVKGSDEYYLKMSILLSQFPIIISSIVDPNLKVLSE